MLSERLVQWTLLKDWQYLQEIFNGIGIKVKRIWGENVRISIGDVLNILDFVLIDDEDNLIIVELETMVSSISKIEHIIEQVSRYSEIVHSGLEGKKVTRIIILYAELPNDEPNNKLRGKLESEIEKISSNQGVNITLCEYKLEEVHSRYESLINNLRSQVGLILPPPVAMDVTHLRRLNRFMAPFRALREKEPEKKELGKGEIKEMAGYSLDSDTVYGVDRRLALDFELVKEAENKRGSLALTSYGEKFIDRMPTYRGESGVIVPLTTEQSRLLLEILVNGNMTSCKANIYYLLRFLHITQGVWLPIPKREPSDRDKEYQTLAEHILGKKYSWATLSDFLRFTTNQAEELGLVRLIKRTEDNPDRVVLTSLGSRVLGLIEIYSYLRRERAWIPLDLVLEKAD